jgi:hypothetical protein
LQLSAVIRQNYRNDSAKNLEMVYTFPVAVGGVLLGMSAAIGEKKLTAAVTERHEAQEKYEKAITKAIRRLWSKLRRAGFTPPISAISKPAKR